MAKTTTDRIREERIEMEIVADAHHVEERALGWYYYLEENLHFPFTAHCIAKRSISPLRPKDEVEVLRMAPEDGCCHEMLVMIPWEKASLAVPLSQIKAGDADGQTHERSRTGTTW